MKVRAKRNLGIAHASGSVAAKLVTALVMVAGACLPGVAAAEFALTSTTLKPGGSLTNAQLYYGFGCNGENISPQLSWQGAPEGTKSYAVVMHDPDAPTGSGWWHWVVFNIPTSVTSLPEGAGDPKAGLIPEAIQSRTDFGSPGYGGACPPQGHGEHRYQFKVFALKTEQLPLDENSPAAMVGYYINGNKLAEAQLEVKYGRD